MASTADLYDLHGDSLQSLPLQLRSFGGIARFEGPIRTIRCFQDNALVKQVLAAPGEGSVLVVDGAGSLETALMGDLIAQSAVDAGWAGVVIHGCVRDSAALAGMPLGVKALGTNPRKSAKTGAGELDVPVEFGGVLFRPGAGLHADEDGVLVER
ncbi:ribonuclease E activity regulator RraA [Microbacterium suwonense]|uniref:4-hydroxy-4-methyl-2-oxoglutarate aldolase n=1 Tax=Microbacterium suwonense TaxID=683047 RepID=A0ABM8FY34_9MICO|nr:ribonuclease E activity regulator RraA [Microbacterium suwonense]BDZ40651.1 putative 4-hydroxy-4-methyl-2-oxoglutarate aldolase [Microbacterium suwonense]